MQIESFKEWLIKEELNDKSRLTRRGLISGLAAGALGLGIGSAKAANTPANDPGVPAPQDSIGMIPQVRQWDHPEKTGHLEGFDDSYIYVRFTDTPDVLSRVPRDSLSARDKEYVAQHEVMLRDRRRLGGNTRPGNQGVQQQQQFQASKKEFNPKFGPQPPIKNPKPIQVWKYQFRLIRDAESRMQRGAKPSVDYVILYKYYNGQMPDPPEE